ncbi:MAG: acyl-CoA synthetase FdrA [Elusimicrobia bacterium]|nr:acyl-CoA synthetase FdrA [Elusimicrobiota bacterium]
MVEESKGQGPLNIVVGGLDLAVVDSLEVRAGHVRVGHAQAPIRRRYDSSLRLNGAKPEMLRTNLDTLKSTLLAQCPAEAISLTPALSPNGGEGEGFETALARALRAGTERLLAGDFAGGAAALKGLGHGLTPSGDDFLAGFLLGLNALQSAFGMDFGTQISTIRRAARSGNRFAEAFLDCAARGRYSLRRDLRGRPGRRAFLRAQSTQARCGLQGDDLMTIKGKVKSGEYFDSVTLMIVGRDVSAAKGVVDAAVVMGTKENKAILKASGLWLAEFDKADDTDLLLAVKAEQEETAAAALQAAEEQLKKVRTRTATSKEQKPRSIEGALKALPGANLALISVAGRYAGSLAHRALDAGLHVMLFSDNVSIETEVELKKRAREKGLLVMGPDCGTAIINGAPLGFANIVRRGDVGIVAAAGTGLQEVSSILSNEGAGVSQAIGTGGRDVKQDVGGIMFLEGIKALMEDDATRVIVLVGKPFHESVLAKVGKAIKAALLAVSLSKGSGGGNGRRAPGLDARHKELAALAAKEAVKAAKGQRDVRGLFSGGTFCTEAQVVFRSLKIGGVRSNVPLAPYLPVKNVLKSKGHTFIDLGDDVFTVGRPHPMIDFSLRKRRIIDEANDTGTAVILLDVVIGCGSNMDPVSELAPSIVEARRLAERARRNLLFACSVTGTPADPQNRGEVEAGLRKAGALVFQSNAAAAAFAARVAMCLEAQ